MNNQDTHPSDQELLQAVDGELSARAAARVERHLTACWSCRARKQDLETAISGFVREHRRQFEPQIPPADGPRALLKARLAQLVQNEAPSSRSWFSPNARKLATIAAGFVLTFAMLALILTRVGSKTRAVYAATVVTPNPSLTPGATVLETRREVCAQSGLKNKAVPVALQRKVFEEYGITGADPRMYEVDYLVTPALGGADDIHNLWPHSHKSTIWNADVKDALEDRLRDLVCSGEVDLSTAQREIATNWIEAYKKYFHTDRPLGHP
jgi:Putative zinc-finger